MVVVPPGFLCQICLSRSAGFSSYFFLGKRFGESAFATDVKPSVKGSLLTFDTSLTQQGKEGFVIGLAAADAFTAVAAVEDRVDGAGIFNAQWARHGNPFIGTPDLCQ